MKRAIKLQVIATNHKLNLLAEFMQKANSEYNHLLSERKGCSKFNDFHAKTYLPCKQNTSFNSQVVCTLIRSAWKKNTEQVKAETIKFNIPRNCKSFKTKANFFVKLGVYPRKRISVPIKQNNNYFRFKKLIDSDWTCKTFGLTNDLQVVTYLSHNKTITQRKNILGVDVNAKRFAVSVINPRGKVLKQVYFGKELWVGKNKIMKRKSFLQSVGAFKKLSKCRKQESDFVKTNIGQIVKQITDLAVEFNADISIENLKKFKPKGRKFNKVVLRIPFYQFRMNLEQRCFDKGIGLSFVDPYHTSKWCPKCGALNQGHTSNNYALYKCSKCGLEVNSDRKASVAIAIKCLLERRIHDSNQTDFFQFSNKRVPVNGLLRSNESCLNFAVHCIQPLEGKAHEFIRG